MAFNFNNDSDTRRAAPAEAPATSPVPGPPAVSPGGPVTSDNPESAAFVRFASCRWQQPAEDGNQAFCTHREVKPYAGTAGFDADAWCPDCQYYKLRRAPKKRSPQDEYTY